MILVAHHDKPLELTAKGTARRNICLAKYEVEIEAIYDAMESSSYAGPLPPTIWDPTTIHSFVREVVEGIMERPVLVDDDLFSLGCDR